MGAWRCNLYEQEEPLFNFKADDNPAQVIRPTIWQVEVRDSRQPPFGASKASPWEDSDYRFDIEWTDKNGKHQESFIAAYEAVRAIWYPKRICGVFTTWGRIEVHMDRYHDPQVYIWQGCDIENKPMKVQWQHY